MIPVTNLLFKNVLPNTDLTCSGKPPILPYPSQPWVVLLLLLCLIFANFVGQNILIIDLSIISDTVVIINLNFFSYVYYLFTFHDL